MPNSAVHRTARRAAPLLLVLAAALAPAAIRAQGTAADYARAAGLDARFEGLAVNLMDAPQWIAGTHRFFYRKSVKGGFEFELVDADAKTKEPAFDHARLATALAAALDTTVTAVTLPFARFTFVDGTREIEFVRSGHAWRCALADYRCRDTGPVRRNFGFGNRGVGGPSPSWGLTPDTEAVPYEGPWDDQWAAEELAEAQQAPTLRESPGFKRSPDGKQEAYIWNYNVYVRPVGARSGTELSYDGSEGNYYSFESIVWAPDSRKLVAYRVVPGYHREVHYVVSTPPDQLQPKDSVRFYQKPGDRLDVRRPVLFELEAHRQIEVSDSLFPNAYNVTVPIWWQDSRGFTFEYNQRGHQVYRVIEVNGETGAARAIVDERSDTFIDYRKMSGNMFDSGRQFRYDLDDGKEMIWASERDGWDHLYLYDDATGRVIGQITKGPWLVRDVEYVDTAAKQIYFSAGGVNAGEDPYFLHYYRIGFDGTGLVSYTPARANHTVSWSDDHEYYVDLYSRVDLPPVGELRRTSDRALVMPLETGDISALVRAGWKAPDVFVAKGRDGTTDIYGVIFKPTTFDPKKKYRVIENIYAGPQGSFVPKSFQVLNGMRNLAELGFIVVQIDGMGTANRSKAFHDVAWHDLADAGYPDRILWHRAVAAKHPWYDVSRGVGIYGTSAGGQNAMAALLFHGDFYKVAYSASGCHDNRMDKIWWNELWMGWPLGPQYIASSNTENAWRLTGKLMLVYGELDTNVDPSSTVQVVNALIKANKTFDLLEIPNSDHTSGGAYGAMKRDDFFVHDLLGVEPPDRNAQVLTSNPIKH
ncbi:MAG: DPP IV N-terminal domain-containing protein [Gemmatimonadota bacterium]|nr:DPP IV N-terminal domain-containing protein [Gemmatimonadota bacterium]